MAYGRSMSPHYICARKALAIWGCLNGNPDEDVDGRVCWIAFLGWLCCTCYKFQRKAFHSIISWRTESVAFEVTYAAAVWDYSILGKNQGKLTELATAYHSWGLRKRATMCAHIRLIQRAYEPTRWTLHGQPSWMTRADVGGKDGNMAVRGINLINLGTGCVFTTWRLGDATWDV